jgi:putative N6-adenine-specific DNA methylase
MYRIRFIAHKDTFLLLLDTSGEGLHKRGYRVRDVEAPMKETLAAALVQLSFYRKDRILVDPCCGSGTIPIEAAMIEARIAPGLNRRFAACDWNNLIDPKLWEDCYAEAREEAKDGIRDSLARQKEWQGRPYIFGSDQDEAIIRAARQNAKRAGVDRMIAFFCCPVAEVKGEEWYGDFGFLISNPPYGERMGEEDEVRQLYRDIRTALMRLPTWSAWLISSYGNLERELGKKAGKKRKLYNGMLRTDYYAFPGPKPPGHR